MEKYESIDVYLRRASVQYGPLSLVVIGGMKEMMVKVKCKLKDMEKASYFCFLFPVLLTIGA